MAFLQTSGTRFTLNGDPFYLFGCTIYQVLIPVNQSSIPSLFADCVSYGYNTVRFTNFMNTSVSAGSEFDSSVYAVIDYALNQALVFGLKVIFETTDINVLAVNRGYTLGDTNTVALYASFFSWLGARVNTVNGRTYNADDTIGMFSLSGELTDQTNGNRLIYTQMSSAAKANFPNTLVCPGGLKPEQNVSSSYGFNNYVAEDVLTIPNIDLCATEPYYTRADMARLFPDMQSYAQTNSKPWMCMEFGYNRSVENDLQRASDLKFVYQQGFKYGCAGFIFWNFDYGQQGGFGISKYSPESLEIVKIFAKTTGYSPRLKVI